MTTTTVKTPTKTLKEGFRYQRQSDPATLTDLNSKLDTAIEKLNGVINGDNTLEIHSAQENANAALENYNKTATLVAYEDFLETDDPMQSALKAGYITVKQLVTVDMLGMKVVSAEDKDTQIDFIALSGIGGRLMGMKTQLYAQQMGYMVLLAKADADGKSIDAVNAAFRTKPLVKVFESAPSKNDLKNALQTLLDEMYFEDNGKGKNRFMVTSGVANWFIDSINRCSYGKGNLSRSAKSPKAIIQTAAALWHSFYNKYGVRTVVDKDNIVTADAVEHEVSEAAAEPKTAGKKAGKKSKA